MTIAFKVDTEIEVAPVMPDGEPRFAVSEQRCYGADEPVEVERVIYGRDEHKGVAHIYFDDGYVAAGVRADSFCIVK